MKMSISNVNHYGNIRGKIFTYDLDCSGFNDVTVIKRTLNRVYSNSVQHITEDDQR